jgi:hypothetical protein
MKFQIKHILKTVMVVIVLVQFTESYGQEKFSSYFFSANFFQIKEEDNLGMVFKGAQLKGGFIYDIPAGENLIIYQNNIGIGLMFSRSMLSAQINFKPIDFLYGFNLSSKGSKFYLGPTLKAEYNLQFYPFLKGGQPFWFTNYSLGIGGNIEFNFNDQLFRIHLSSSLIGFVSRPQFDRDPYWMDFSILGIVKQAHQKFKFFTPGDLISTSFQLEYFPDLEDHAVSISYNLEYFGTNYKPKVAFIDQCIEVKLSL